MAAIKGTVTFEGNVVRLPQFVGDDNEYIVWDYIVGPNDENVMFAPFEGKRVRVTVEVLKN